MWHALRKYPVQSGARAEVAGITSRGFLGWDEKATLVVTYPSGKAKTAFLRRRRNVRAGQRFAARFNAAAASL
jgi:hypothetical protein